MAQKTEKEETEFQVKEALTSRVTATAATVTAASCKAEATERSTPATVSLKDPPPISRKRPDREETEVTDTKREVKRCSGCKRRVGLMGFPCRCGELFCSEHRYSDRHDCSFDYKTAGREAIARENPVVKAAKIVRV